ncbi:LysR family transcriptional regulator [Methylobacterium sp. Leaf456]|uniref:winged helix-turn-helix domain-containing protein n=1 Tax=Methylobacterium sp. Leaf456 TaxID=1736382 RepID=UPI0006F2E237|nr:LysR family transcriptional regulator [Methylobacterium sp. Leaf456]KQT58665.1 LysR family transcriptional regulator [Methylobacterium sp. Leaf456]
MARLSIRVDLGPGHRLGPGKVRLLEAIAEHGSISAGARALGMSYRRAWMLVEAMNRGFGAALVESQAGGRAGGGARLSDLGTEVAAAYRAVERAAEEAAAPALRRLAALCPESGAHTKT